MPIARAPSPVARVPFGTAPDGTAVDVFALSAGGVELRAMSYGGIITELCTPDRNGRMGNVVLGHDTLEPYLSASPYLGAIVGRCANRIANGRFALDGTQYHVTTNDGAHHLHGGGRGFDKVNWRAVSFYCEESAGVAFTHTSPDGDEGYPGTLSAKVCYTITTAGELVVEYSATTDRPTVINLSQHSYFNLGGSATPDILSHRLTVYTDSYTPVDPQLIPTGDIAPVANTPFDFRTPTAIGARIDEPNAQLGYAGGFDHNFVLRKPAASGPLVHAASLVEPISGRRLDIHTTEPGLQLYSGNFLDGTIRGRGGRPFGHRGGLCLETQHFPDSPNQPAFPSVVLRPGGRYASRTVYAFGVEW
jgi:aldose 1-epimerase